MVRRIPPGRVATYGQIARLVRGCTARMVGYAMAALPDGSDVPWQRVINHQGRVSERTQGHGKEIQRTLLELEGIRFDDRDRVNLGEVLWTGPRDERNAGPDFPDSE